MNRLVRYVTGTIVLLSLVAALILPALVFRGLSPASIELCRKRSSGDDSPWDPGDESPSIGGRIVSWLPASILNPSEGLSTPGAILLLAKKDDTPWDPGDESARHNGEVRHA